MTKKPILASLASSNLDDISNRNMKFGNLVKFLDQYCGKKIRPFRVFQCEVIKASI